MKVTGYTLLEAIHKYELLRDQAKADFTDSLWKFADEEKEDPKQILARFEEYERIIARLQTAQAHYNLKVVVTMPDKTTLPLCEAIKSLGGRQRVANILNYASREDGGLSIFHSRRDRSRDKDTEEAKRTLTKKELANLATDASKFLSSLRTAIATSNAVEIDISGGLDPLFFE